MYVFFHVAMAGPHVHCTISSCSSFIFVILYSHDPLVLVLHPLVMLHLGYHLINLYGIVESTAYFYSSPVRKSSSLAFAVHCK